MKNDLYTSLTMLKEESCWSTTSMEISFPKHFYLKSLISFSKTVHLTTLLKEAPLALRISPMLVSAWRASAFTSCKQSPLYKFQQYRISTKKFLLLLNLHKHYWGTYISNPNAILFEKENIFPNGRVTANVIVHKFRHHFRIQS